MSIYKGLIFDLDGVLVDTAKYHFIAWKQIADNINVPFNKADNERLKGVSRMNSLEIILEIGGLSLSLREKENLCKQKNDIYLSYIRRLAKSEILDGAEAFLTEAREQGYKLALGSASKNSRLILERLEIEGFFDAVIDGTKVTKAKPDPEVFIRGAEELQLENEECMVFEDSLAGIRAARAAGMRAVGIGDPVNLPGADIVIHGFTGITIDDIIS